MSVIDGIATHWIKIAADRWPRDLRDDLTSEWTAEMRMMSAFRRLRFAFSLAASPPVEDENGAPMGWREIVPGVARRVRPFFVLYLAGCAVMLMAAAASTFAGFAERLTQTGYYTTPRTSLGIAIYVLITLIAYTAFGFLGTFLARRYPLVRGPRTALARLLWTLAAVAAVAAGMATETLLFDVGPVQLAAVGMWAIAVGIVCVGAVLIARGGLLWLGRVLGVGLGLILFDLVSIELGVRQAARRILGVTETGSTYDAGPYIDPSRVDVSHGPLWFLGALAGPDPASQVSPDADAEIATWLSQIILAMMLGLLFAVCYTVRTAVLTPALTPARARVRAPRVVVPVPITPARRSRPLSLAISGIALATWSLALAFLPSRVARYEADPEFGIWTYEVRLAAIVLAALGLAFALTGRGRALWPPVAAGAALIVTDQVLSHTGLPEPTTAAVAAATGGLLIWAAWWLGVNLRGGSTPESVRQGRMAIAFLAAALTPALYLQATWPDTIETDPPTPWGLPAGTACVAGALAVLAVVAAQSARRNPLRPGTGVVLALSAGLAFTAAGTITGLPSAQPMLLALTGGPWTVAVTALIAWDRPARPWRARSLWTLAALGAIPVYAVSFYILLIPGMGTEELLLTGAGFGGAWDGVGTFLPVLGVAATYSMIASRVLRKSRRVPTAAAWQPLPTT